ncbi:hypothetical protein Lqui_1343 [Legionella quinlivanii]|uniref:Uncharacterized protein n=1 Tax=Legionella quinlivanii TaxID=45073 RepID=A0A0W0Y035_9GAMM|nr:hypothetical protein [Legionella quinlivanii]KTD50018.1 hypothetical protein Lqui_1343 [Legionella quinlivanii]SEF94523.1 hypothetical protein SAMN02746093_01454 [Legionella quinlivanii DSM 21216]STY11206.1 Uncharacterised protein [Legionella quinlivanii]
MPLNQEAIETLPTREHNNDERSDLESLLQQMQKDRKQMHQNWQDFCLKAEKLLEKMADEHVKLTKAITEQYEKAVDDTLSTFESDFAEISRMSTPENASVSLSDRFFNKFAKYDAELGKPDHEKAASDSLSKMTNG